MQKILVGGPVRQDPHILCAYLFSLKRLQKTGLQLDFCFIDDNSSLLASHILQAFVQHERATLLAPKKHADTPYVKNTTQNPHWNEALIWKVAGYRNQMIHQCLNQGYDGLFMVDSDIILHPPTLKQLIDTKKPIISEIFWTQWRAEEPPMPQVWMYNEYDHAHPQLPEQERNTIGSELLQRWQNPGVYPVGGLGACTYFCRTALQKGASYTPIPNLTFWGEDRHFCIRAGALGIPLHVDTHYPALHLFNAEQLSSLHTLKKIYTQPGILRLINMMHLVGVLFTLQKNQTSLRGLHLLEPSYRIKKTKELSRQLKRAHSKAMQLFCFPFDAQNIDAHTLHITVVQIVIRPAQTKVDTLKLEIKCDPHTQLVTQISPLKSERP